MGQCDRKNKHLSYYPLQGLPSITEGSVIMGESALPMQSITQVPVSPFWEYQDSVFTWMVISYYPSFGQLAGQLWLDGVSTFGDVLALHVLFALRHA